MVFTPMAQDPREAYTPSTTYITSSFSGFSHTARVNDAASLGEGGEEKQFLWFPKIKLVALLGALGHRSCLSTAMQPPRPAENRAVWLGGEDLWGQSWMQIRWVQNWRLAASVALWQNVLRSGSPHVAWVGTMETFLKAPTFSNLGKRPCESAKEMAAKYAKINVSMTWGKKRKPGERAKRLMFTKKHSPPDKAFLSK